MGLLAGTLAQAYDRTQQAIRQEIAAHGSSVFGFEERRAESATVGQLVGGAMKDALKSKVLGPFAGSHHVVDGVQIYGIETGGVRQLYVQPFAQQLALPGEHHVALPGAMRSPIVYRQATVRWGWDAGGDEELATWLNGEPSLKAAAKGLEDVWVCGKESWAHDWTAQLMALGDGRSHLVVQAGSHGGMLGPMRVGVGPFVQLGGALGRWLTGQPTAPHAPLRPVRYSDLFYEYVLGGAPAPAAPNRAGVDFSEVLRAAGAPFESATMQLAPIDPKIEANVRAHVLPPHRAEAPLVAVLDLTALGSGKDAVALTPDALYSKEFDETCGFAFEELQAAHPPKGLMGKTVRAQLQSRAVKVPCGGDGDALHAMLSAVLQARG